MSAIAVILLAGVVDRWYLGLEWFGLVPPVRILAVGTATLAGLVFYFAWLWYASRTDNPAPDELGDIEASE